MQVPLIRLQCGCNSYEWGKPGHESAAARLASATGLHVETGKPYAELWMGTHPSLPSRDLETQRTLLNLVQDNQALMSHEVGKKYGNKLPFLFKVLSISKALSIQAHPNKKLAEQLHAKDPRNYPDDNHKPEMTIALTPFVGLCGFRPLSEISFFLTEVKPLRSLVGDHVAENFTSLVGGHETSEDAGQTTRNKAALRSLFSALMQNALSDQETLKSHAEALVSLANSGSLPQDPAGELTEEDTPSVASQVLTCHSQYPNDVGLFALFFLNIVYLSPGESLYLQADDIHAYLSGDIVECMASSDNVVRAGFTPKFKDINTLTEMLTYEYKPIEEQKLVPTEYPFVKLNTVAYTAGSSTVVYDPPIEEFAVVKTDLIAPRAKATFEPLDGPSIVICTAGAGKISVGHHSREVKEGYVFFVGAKAECILESASGDGEPFTTFKAFCELDEEPTVNGK